MRPADTVETGRTCSPSSRNRRPGSTEASISTGLDGEDRTSVWRTRHAYLAAVFTHHTEHDGESKTCADARGLGGEERIEDTRKNRLRNARSAVDDLENHPVVSIPRRPQPDGSRFSRLHDGLPRISDQIHQHLLQLAGVAGDERKRGIEVQLNANSFRSRSEALQIHGALHHLIESDSLAFRPGLPGAQQELAKDGPGPLRFFINLARFFGAAREVFANEEPLRVAQNAGQGIA